MGLVDSDFNNFATKLTRRFSDRSKGLDADSRRILSARPSDQILAGFLRQFDRISLHHCQDRARQKIRMNSRT